MWQIIGIIISIILIYLFFRYKYLKFSNKIVTSIDNLINEKYEEENINKETLDSKIESKLYKLREIVKGKNEKTNKTKAEIQQMVSDITHQVKTPISNIRMYSDTILNNDLSKEKEEEFLNIISNQIDKLEFLMNSLNEMSRLETNMITLNKESLKIVECLEKAKEQVKSLAEKKNIQIEIDGDTYAIVKYDKKWTLEAICNILENAIKYTDENGEIVINVEKLESFLKINIIDNGIGIESENINNVFKRFLESKRLVVLMVLE